MRDDLDIFVDDVTTDDQLDAMMLDLELMQIERRTQAEERLISLVMGIDRELKPHGLKMSSKRKKAILKAIDALMTASDMSRP